ncbi:MAG TPA: DUF503 domain-containing protein [Bacillota bacterium]
MVGVARLELHMPENGSLKDKRRIVRSLLDRLRSRFNVAAAEVERQDRWDAAVLALVCVSNEAAHVDAMLTEIVGWVDAQTHGRLVRVEREFR